MTRITPWIVLATILLLIAPAVAAQADDPNKPTSDPERPDDAAWVEDCPPDMMCAASSEPDARDENISYGPEDCIECSSPMPAEGDDTVWGTDCPEGMYCILNDGADDSTSSDGAGSSDEDAGTTVAESPVAAIVPLFVLLGVALVAAFPRRQRR